MAYDGLIIESMGTSFGESSAGWDERGGDAFVSDVSNAEVDAGGVDALFLREILTCVEGTFSGCVRLIARNGVAGEDEASVGLLVHGEGDVVEAGLGLVVYADGPFLIAYKTDGAELLGLRDDWRRRHGDDYACSGASDVADIVGYGACDGNDTCAEAGGRKRGRRSGTGDDTGGGGVGVGETTFWNAFCGGSDGKVGAG